RPPPPPTGMRAMARPYPPGAPPWGSPDPSGLTGAPPRGSPAVTACPGDRLGFPHPCPTPSPSTRPGGGPWPPRGRPPGPAPARPARRPCGPPWNGSGPSRSIPSTWAPAATSWSWPPAPAPMNRAPSTGSTVAPRSPELVLAARAGPHDRAAFDRLVYRRRAGFEYWGHAASFLPMASYRLCLPPEGGRTQGPPGRGGG